MSESVPFCEDFVCGVHALRAHSANKPQRPSSRILQLKTAMSRAPNPKKAAFPVSLLHAHRAAAGLTRTAGAVHCRGCPRPLWAQESPLPFFLLPERAPRWLRCVGRVAPRAVQRARHQGRPSSSSGSALTTCQARTPAGHAQEHCCAVGLAGRRGCQVALHPNSSPVCVGFVGGCCTPSALHASPGRPQTTSSRGGPSRAP